jgi:hypothetical protein
MNLPDFLLTLISTAAISTALAGLVLWITKSWISERLKNAIKAEYDTKLESHKAQLKAEYEKDLETHKIALKASADLELEKLKSSLAVVAAEKNTTFSKLHDRRIEIIAKTYSLLSHLRDCVAEYVKAFEFSGDPPREERRKNTVTAFYELKPYFSQNRIFLPKLIATNIENTNLELLKIINSFMIKVDLAKTPDFNEWIKITEKLDGDFKLTLESLEDELRVAIGDKNS